MDDKRFITLALGKVSPENPSPAELKFDLDDLETHKVRKLNIAIMEASNSVAKEIQAKKDQIIELVKGLNEVEDQKKQLEGESDEDFTARQEALAPRIAELEETRAKLAEENKIDTSFERLCFLCLKAVAELFNQGNKVTEKSFSFTPWVRVKEVLFKICSEGDLASAQLFRSPEQIEQDRVI